MINATAFARPTPSLSPHVWADQLEQHLRSKPGR